MLRTKTATTDRPFLIAGESGTGGELAARALREVSDRPPRALASANCAATLPPLPDNPWFVRLADFHKMCSRQTDTRRSFSVKKSCSSQLPAGRSICENGLVDWPPSSRTQSRSGGSQPADGGTIFSEGVDEFAAKFHSNPRLGLEVGDAEPQSQPRVALWMRSGNPTLRVAMMDGKAGQERLKIEPEKIEPAEAADDMNFQGHQQVPESERIALDTACPLLVWTLWTNPLSRPLSR
jgi:hypothetical protein